MSDESVHCWMRDCKVPVCSGGLCDEHACEANPFELGESEFTRCTALKHGEHYCEKHICPALGCENLKEISAAHCETHACKADLSQLEGENTGHCKHVRDTTNGSDYCMWHACPGLAGQARCGRPKNCRDMHCEICRDIWWSAMHHKHSS